jgi:conjugal transfer pilus assembly protein TraI
MCPLQIKTGSITWNPYSESLHDWAYRHGIDRYFIRWRDKRHKRHEQFSLLAWHRIIPAETQEFLSKSGPSIIEAMLEAISGTSVNQPVTKLMLRADQESVSRDLRQSRLDVNEFSMVCLSNGTFSMPSAAWLKPENGRSMSQVRKFGT